MNDAGLLAADVAGYRLAYSWNDEAVRRAFEDGWPRSFGNAMRLFGDLVGVAAIETLGLFDRAGMSKVEMSAAIWRAAEGYYTVKLMDGGAA